MSALCHSGCKTGAFMPFVHLVIALALVEFFLFGVAVARARARYNIPAPDTTRHEVFQSHFRVQMNTLEHFVARGGRRGVDIAGARSEEHTTELPSQSNLHCRI